MVEGVSGMAEAGVCDDYRKLPGKLPKWFCFQKSPHG